MTVIETERLIFRRLTLEDADELAALYSDPEVMRFFGGVRSRQQAVEQIEECMRMYNKLGFSFWATIHKVDNRFIGRCGLLHQIFGDRHEYEVAYAIARAYWNQGLATEAARAIKDYAFDNFEFPRLISLIDPLNIASTRVAEKNGMRYLEDIVFRGHVCRCYAVDRKGAQAAAKAAA